ncbi:MAG: hypothetical protein SNG96_07405, partial [Rikenellaceae bacterium]
MTTTLRKIFDALLYPIYTPIYAVLMLYFTATPYSNLFIKERLFIFGVVMLYTILIPKPLVHIAEKRLNIRMTRWRTHLVYALSHATCYYTLKGLIGVEPILQILVATIICELLIPTLGRHRNSSSMTLGLLLSFIIIMNLVSGYIGDLFPLLIGLILMTGVVCTLQFGAIYTKRRHVITSLMLGGAT